MYLEATIATANGRTTDEVEDARGSKVTVRTLALMETQERVHRLGISAR